MQNELRFINFLWFIQFILICYLFFDFLRFSLLKSIMVVLPCRDGDFNALGSFHSKLKMF